MAKWGWVAALTAAVVIARADGVAARAIVVRSGNAPIGSLDPQVRYLAGRPACPLRLAPFTPTDFSDACAGPQATVVTNHPAWIGGLTTDPLARWVALDESWGQGRGLYCQHFNLPALPSCGASLDLAYAGDDSIGDTWPDSCGTPGSAPNPVGMYLNGQPLIPPGGWPTGGFTFETTVTIADVRAMLVLGAAPFAACCCWMSPASVGGERP